MRYLNCKQSINILMVLLLVVAPFQSLFAKSMMNHDNQASHAAMTMAVEAAIDFDKSTVNMMSMDGCSHSHAAADHQSGTHASTDTSTHIDSEATNQDCENQCQHCVFFGVVVISSDLSNESLVSIYNSHITIHSLGITSDVAIRPPRYILPV